MIEFTEMSKTEFENYKNIFIKEDTIEVSENYGYSLEQAKINAQSDFDKCFPNGKTKKDEFLVSICSNHSGTFTVLGYLWYSLSKDYIFILDFYIHNQYRNQGNGTKTFETLQKIALEKNIHQLRLRVARTNQRALKLYQELGFETTGINMNKWF